MFNLPRMQSSLRWRCWLPTLVSVIAIGCTETDGLDWTSTGQSISGGISGELAGHSVSLSHDGSTVAVGSPESNGSRGRTRVFGLDGSNKWLQIGGDIHGEAPGDMSGSSLAISGDGKTLAVGADRNCGQDCGFSFSVWSGHVRVYRLNAAGTAWSQLGGDIDSEYSGDRFGTKVSISYDGNVVAISGVDNDVNAYDAGHVRVLKWVGHGTANGWQQLGADIDGEYTVENSGAALALSADGKIVAVGSAQCCMGGAGSWDAGRVRVFAYNDSTLAWTKLGEDINGIGGDELGSAVSLSHDGHTVAVGANPYSKIGFVRILRWTSGTWSIVSTIDGEVIGDGTGTVVRLSSDASRVAVGAPQGIDDNVVSGHVRVFEWVGHGYANGWKLLGRKIIGQHSLGKTGETLSLSADGSKLAIGSPGVANEKGLVDIVGLQESKYILIEAMRDCYGGNLHRYVPASKEVCELYCNSDFGCTGFSYKESDLHCITKSLEVAKSTLILIFVVEMLFEHEITCFML